MTPDRQRGMPATGFEAARPGATASAWWSP